MRWRVVLSVLAVMIMWSCMTTKKTTEQQFELHDLMALDISQADTIWVPWQLWSQDTQPPAPIIRHTATQAKQNHDIHQTSKETSSKDFNSRQSFRLNKFLIIACLTGLVFIIVVYVERR